MNENKTPIKQLTDALADMTERAMAAEKARDEANARSLEWYRKYEQKDKDHKEMEAILAAEIQGHKNTKAELEEAARAVHVLSDELERLTKPGKPEI